MVRTMCTLQCQVRTDYFKVIFVILTHDYLDDLLGSCAQPCSPPKPLVHPWTFRSRNSQLVPRFQSFPRDEADVYPGAVYISTVPGIKPNLEPLRQFPGFSDVHGAGIYIGIRVCINPSVQRSLANFRHGHGYFLRWTNQKNTRYISTQGALPAIG